MLKKKSFIVKGKQKSNRPGCSPTVVATLHLVRDMFVEGRAFHALYRHSQLSSLVGREALPVQPLLYQDLDPLKKGKITPCTSICLHTV